MDKRWEIIIIGGGPAGLLAAGEAAGAGVPTLLLEKMDRPGRKLRITGKGRCNLTNVAPLEVFLKHFHPHGRFLHHAFRRFFTEDLIEFLGSLGVETTTERGGRVFPRSNDAQQVVSALRNWVEAQGAAIRTGRQVSSIVRDGDAWRITAERSRIRGSQTVEDGKPEHHSYLTRAVILATGGASYPGTGSTGDGYRLAADLGHPVTPIRPALIPLITAGDVARRLQGLSLRNVKATLLVDDRSQAQEFGEMLFTHNGLSGPIILTLSRRAVDAVMAGGRVTISIDLKPALEHHILDARLQRDFDAHGKRYFQTLLVDLLPRSLIPICIEKTGIPAEKPGHQISSDERKRLRLWLKDFRLDVNGYAPLAQAIVTAGGIDLKQVDPHNMQSRLHPGLFFAGEVLDLDADTGGYNLQASFSTGWLAGRSAAKFVQGR